MPYDRFAHWTDLPRMRPTLHDSMLMQAHGTDELPPQKPEWLDEYAQEYDDVWAAVKLIEEYGGVLDESPYVPLTQEQWDEKKAYEAALKEWKQRHPRIKEDWSWMDPKDMANE